jgi:maltose O-acetyltransferase
MSSTDTETDADSDKIDHRSQKERMLAGDLYIAEDRELQAASRRAYRLSREYETRYAVDLDSAQQVLHQMLGAVGPDVNIKPPLYVDYGKYITVGARTFVNYGLMALDVAPITIGEDVQIGPNVQLLTPTHPIDPELRRQKYEAAKPIVIGNNVWLGGAIVLAGVTIGENSVIGAGAVVTRDIPPNVVAAGNPARVIREIAQTPDDGADA